MKRDKEGKGNKAPGGVTKTLFVSAGDKHIKKERQKARVLKKTRWWQNQLKKGRCYYCEKEFGPSLLNMEHLVPLARGGMSIKNNVVPSCKACNVAKKHKTILEVRLQKP